MSTADGESSKEVMLLAAFRMAFDNLNPPDLHENVQIRRMKDLFLSAPENQGNQCD